MCLKTQININPLIIGDFNSPLSPTDGPSGQKIKQRPSELTDIIHLMDLTDIYRMFQPNTKEYTFYSVARGSVSKIDHILGHNTKFYKFKKIGITSCVLSDHNAMKLNGVSKQTSSNRTKSWGLNNLL